MQSPRAWVKNRKAMRRRPGSTELRPIRWLPTTVIVATAMIGGGLMALWLLSAWAERHASGMTARDAANLQLDAIKTALTVAAGLGAGVTLLVAIRKQSITERAQQFTEEDAGEERSTALYVAAVEQLGSDKAAVRLGGMYALERLGQYNPHLRQTVVDVICAYLRMPFEPPSKMATQHVNRPLIAMKRRIPDYFTSKGVAQNAPEELLVRTTAQTILTQHLYKHGTDRDWPRRRQPQEIGFWPGMDLDLCGATLVNFVLQGRVEVADFSGARFIGGTNFAHAEFDGHAYFTGAKFEDGLAYFFGAWFGLRAIFCDTDFGHAEANFVGATFCGMTFFGGATLDGGVTLKNARALTDFDTSWGATREWPDGWTERSLASNEKMPRPYGRWDSSAAGCPGDKTWTLIVPADSGQ